MEIIYSGNTHIKHTQTDELLFYIEEVGKNELRPLDSGGERTFPRLPNAARADDRREAAGVRTAER